MTAVQLSPFCPAAIWLCVAAVAVSSAASTPAADADTPAVQTAPGAGRNPVAAPSSAASTPVEPPSDGPRLFRGKVSLLREALKRHKVDSREEFEKQVALETPQGEIIPIVADWRGRAFFQDKRLRDRDVELVGKRKAGVPYLQVLMVFTFDEKGSRQYTDYYCDTCGFPMYEIKPCECCQGAVRLRFQKRDLPDYLRSKDAADRPAPNGPRANEATAPRP